MHVKKFCCTEIKGNIYFTVPDCALDIGIAVDIGTVKKPVTQVEVNCGQHYIYS